MNSKRRSRLQEGIDILGEVIDGEQEAFDNMPENIRDAEKGQAVEEGLDNLNEAKDLLDEVASSLVIMVRFLRALCSKRAGQPAPSFNNSTNSGHCILISSLRSHLRRIFCGHFGIGHSGERSNGLRSKGMAIRREKLKARVAPAGDC